MSFSFSQFFANQARKPDGLFGRFYMSFAFDRGNRPLNDFVRGTIGIKDGDRALEIGCGTGQLIRETARQLRKGMVSGIDFSPPMVEVALKKNRSHINSGRVEIISGDFDKAEFDENSFDIIFTVNTIYFWQAPEATVSKIYALLKPGGKLVIGFHDRKEMESMPDNDVFRFYSARDVETLLSASAPFASVETVSRRTGNKNGFCAVGTK